MTSEKFVKQYFPNAFLYVGKSEGAGHREVTTYNIYIPNGKKYRSIGSGKNAANAWASVKRTIEESGIK